MDEWLNVWINVIPWILMSVSEEENKLMVTGGKGVGRDKLGDWDWHIHTAPYKIDNKDLLFSTGN